MGRRRTGEVERGDRVEARRQDSYVHAMREQPAILLASRLFAVGRVVGIALIELVRVLGQRVDVVVVVRFGLGAAHETVTIAPGQAPELGRTLGPLPRVGQQLEAAGELERQQIVAVDQEPVEHVQAYVVATCNNVIYIAEKVIVCARYVKHIDQKYVSIHTR